MAKNAFVTFGSYVPTNGSTNYYTVMSNQMLPEAALSYLRLCCTVSSAAPQAAAAAAALTIRQVDAFTDVIGFASASLTAVLFWPVTI